MTSFESIKQRIKEANDLVALIESYVPLQRRGRVLVALCPFHQEKTPSFTVWPDSQHWKCFGCQKAGDLFTFLMEREGWTFRETCERLAARAGIPVEGMFRGERSQPRGPDPAQALDHVRRFFAQELAGPSGGEARAYLQRRGLSDAVLPFGIGWHPLAQGRLLEFARRQQLPFALLEQAGLLRQDHSEPFRGRVMFPIVDERGRVVAFGGRVLGDQKPKYLNSPESPFFNKRKLLFGLDHVKRAGTRRIVVMEGYTDVIACHLAGFTGAVATLGTALTSDHVRQLQRYAGGPDGGIVLLFDGDAAGRRAADRAFRELAGSGLELRIALLPEGTDPADRVAARPGLDAAAVEAGRADLRQRIDAAEDAMAVWFRLLRERHDWSHEAQVEPALAECAGILAGVGQDAVRQVMLGRMAGQLGLPPELLVRALRRRLRPQVERAGTGPAPAAGAGPGAPATGAAPAPAVSPGLQAEAEVLASLLHRPELVAELPDGLLQDPGLQAVVVAIRGAVAGGEARPEQVQQRAFTAAAGQPALSALVADAHTRGQASADPELSFRAAVRGLRLAQAREQAQKARVELRQAEAAGDQARVQELTQRYLTLLRDA